MSDGSSESEALHDISHGAVISVGGVSTKKLLGFLSNLVLTSGLGVSGYGLYALGMQFVAILARFAPLGTTTTIVKYVAAYRDEPERREQVVGLTYLTTLIASGLLAAVLFFSADQVNALTANMRVFPAVLRLFALTLPPSALVTVHVYLLRATERVNTQVAVESVVRPGVRLFAVVVALMLGHTVVGVVGALAVTMGVLALTVGWFAVRRTGISPRLRGASAEARTFYNHSGPNALSFVAGFLRVRVGFLFVGYFLTAGAMGVYNLALFLGSVLSIPLVAFNQLMPPVASRLYEANDIPTLRVVYRTVTRLIVTCTVPMLAAMIVFRVELLGLFGASYIRGATVLAVLLGAFAVDNAVGGTSWILVMTDHQYARMTLDWLLGILNVAVSYLLILQYGLIGVAVATGLSIVVQNLLQIGLLWRLEGLQPFDITFLNPVGAGLISGIVMLGTRSVMEGLVSFGVGTILGGGAYLGALLIIGLQPRDQEIISALFEQYQIIARETIDIVVQIVRDITW